jgi:aspartyl-tRNA(Asn)/glutamyl-tRNA(Gln) amidotransferase subunit A
MSELVRPVDFAAIAATVASHSRDVKDRAPGAAKGPHMRSVTPQDGSGGPGNPGEAGLAAWSATELLAAYASREVSPTEAVEAVAAVVADREPTLNAFWQVDLDAARAAAKASADRWAAGEPLGPIDGVPVTVKENLARAGVPMPAGSAAVVPVVPQRDSPVAERIGEAGGVLLGSTVMPDWGMLSSGVSSLHGITRSPWNPAWTTGGSSSGAGAAAAAGYGPLHVGTDIGGSIRLPGSWLGLATMKPSAGRVPLDAPYLGRCAGPMTRTVADAALLLKVISRPDARDWTSLPPEELPLEDLDLDVRGLRIGLQLEPGAGTVTDPEVRAAVEAAAAVLADAGAEVEPLAPFMTEQMLLDLDQFWRVRSWADYAALPVERKRLVLPYIVQWVHGGADVPGARVIECYHSIMALQQATVAATLPFDAVLSPVAPQAAFPAEWPMPWGEEDLGMAHIGFTAPANMSGQPAATVNCGFTADGRPVGLQLAGRRFDDVGVLRLAAWYERHRGAAAEPAWPIGRPGPSDGPSDGPAPGRRGRGSRE